MGLAEGTKRRAGIPESSCSRLISASVALWVSHSVGRRTFITLSFGDWEEGIAPFGHLGWTSICCFLCVLARAAGQDFRFQK